MTAAAGLVRSDLQLGGVGPICAIVAAEILAVDWTTAFLVAAFSEAHRYLLGSSALLVIIGIAGQRIGCGVIERSYRESGTS
jgi:hypothetical protein